jgi:hypothetical protein
VTQFDFPIQNAKQQERRNGFAPALRIAETDHVEGMKRLMQAIFRMPVGSFGTLPALAQASFVENARSITLAEPTPTVVTCDMLAKLAAPVLMMTGDKDKTDRLHILNANRVTGCMKTRVQRVD